MRSLLVVAGLNLTLAVLAVGSFLWIGPTVGIAVAVFGLALDTLSVFTVRLLGGESRRAAPQGTSEPLDKFWVSISNCGIKSSDHDPCLEDSSKAFDWSAISAERRPGVEVALKEAQEATLAGEWELALQKYRKLAQDWSGQPGLHHNLGLLELAVGEEMKARLSFLRALSLGPEDRESKPLVAEDSSDADWAQKAYERACVKVPGSPEPARHYVRYLRCRGEFSQALQVLESFVREHPAMEGALARDLGVLHVLNDRPEEVERLLQPRLESVPSDRESWLVRGFAGIMGQDLITARESFRNGLLRSVGDPALTLLAAHRLGLGLVAYAEGNLELASEHATAIYRLDPEHEGALLLLALTGGGEIFPGLEKALERWAQRDEGGLATYIAARRALLQGDTEFSIFTLRSISGPQPLMGAVLRAQALSFLSVGRSEEARGVLRRAGETRRTFEFDVLDAVCEVQKSGQEAGLRALELIREEHGERALVYHLLAELHSRNGQDSTVFCPPFLFEQVSGLLWTPDAQSLARFLVEHHGSI